MYREFVPRTTWSKCTFSAHETSTNRSPPISLFFRRQKIWLLSSRDCFRLSPNREIELLGYFVRSNKSNMREREIWKLTNGKGIISQHSVIDFPLEISQSIQSIAIALGKVCASEVRMNMNTLAGPGWVLRMSSTFTQG